MGRFIITLRATRHDMKQLYRKAFATLQHSTALQGFNTRLVRQPVINGLVVRISD